MCANASGIELWYWHGLVASGWNYDIGALQANGSEYWIMILVHFDATGIELWYGLLSANSWLWVILLSITTSVVRSVAGLQTHPSGRIRRQQLSQSSRSHSSHAFREYTSRTEVMSSSVSIVLLLYRLTNVPQFAFKEKVDQSSRTHGAAGSKLRCLELN